MPLISHTARLSTACLLSAALWLQAGCTSTKDKPKPEEDNTRTIEVVTALNREVAIRENKLGLEHLDKDELKDAEQAFKRAVQADRTFGPAFNHLGKVYYKQGLYYQAAHQFDRASKLMPNQAAPHYNIGLTLSAAGKNNDSVEHFRKALTLEPTNLVYQAELANALVVRGDETAEVITLLKSIAEKDERLSVRVWARTQLGRLGLDPE